jgi:hypothetical protein
VKRSADVPALPAFVLEKFRQTKEIEPEGKERKPLGSEGALASDYLLVRPQGRATSSSKAESDP